uniref:Uncharacterized protein n=1 Tax=Equus caballus TaxID=9796 RepID=A0A9L0RJ40_HORSE
MCRNAIEFCVPSLYPASLLNSFIRLNRFSVVSIEFSLSKSISSANSDSLTSSFPIWMAFISFSCLNALVSTSSTMLNESDKITHLCLIPDLTGKAFSLSALSIMFTAAFSYMAFNMWRSFSSISICRMFLS